MQPRSAEERREALVELYREASRLYTLPAAPGPHQGRVRRRQRRRRPDVRRRGARPAGGPPGAALRGPGRQAARPAARRGRAGAVGRVHHERPEEPPARQPRPCSSTRSTPASRTSHRQVELIEPRVICTLGNFATKLLTRSQRGITGVHGRPQVHELGGRAVRVFPIYHPAAALRSTKTLEELREDFQRLPELLEEPAPVPIGAVAPGGGGRGGAGARAAADQPVRLTSLESSSPQETEAAGAELAARLGAGRRRAGQRRAGHRQDHVRARRVPGARGRGPGDEPDLHGRPRAGRRPRRSRISTCTGSSRWPARTRRCSTTT